MIEIKPAKYSNHLNHLRNEQKISEQLSSLKITKAMYKY